MARTAIALIALLLLAPGCTGPGQWLRNGFKVGPSYCPPPAEVAPNWIDESTTPKISTVPPNDYAWWTVFQDPTLNALIDTAYRQNLDLQAAGTRILDARAQRNVAVGNLFPQTQTATAAYAHAQLSKNLNILPGAPSGGAINAYIDGFNASWEIDFWGRYRRTIESSNANVDAQFEAYGDTLVMMMSEVAKSYVQIRTFQQRIAYAQQNVEIQTGSLGITSARFRDGLSSELDVTQARANLAQTEALIPALRAGLRQSNNALGVLLGMPPSDLVSQFGAAPIPQAPATVAIGVPADLLRRRPDVRQAERLVAAQSAQIGVAQADFYPRFAINGFIGYGANDFKHLFDSSSLTTFIFPSAQWNILNYGRIVNNVRSQDARLQTVTLQYQATVLRAGREVEDGLVQFIEAQKQAVFLAESVKQATRSVDLVTLQFKGGLTDFNRVYTTQAQLVTQQDQLASTQGNIALQLIAVYRALGGGWEYFREGMGMPQGPELLPQVEPEANEVLPKPQPVPAQKP